MDAAIDTLEALFKKADSELELIKTRLGVDFAERFKPGSQELNPMVLVPRIQRAHCKFAQLTAQRAQIHEEMKVVSEELVSLTAQNCNKLRTLQALAGQTAEPTEDEALVCDLAGVRLPNNSTTSSIDEVSSSSSLADLSSVTNFHDGTTAVQHSIVDSSPELVGHENPSSMLGFTARVSTASQRLSDPSTFHPISEEEFLSVSNLIRGRAKLDEVNQVYRQLFNHFCSSKKQTPLTVPRMTEMGLRITGATGQAKLKVLRALKVIHMSSSNSVKLV